jgi:hypothetical protein
MVALVRGSVRSERAQQLGSELNSTCSSSSDLDVVPVSRIAAGVWSRLRAVVLVTFDTLMQCGGPASIMRPTSRHWTVKRNKNKSESILREGHLKS